MTCVTSLESNLFRTNALRPLFTPKRWRRTAHSLAERRPAQRGLGKDRERQPEATPTRMVSLGASANRPAEPSQLNARLWQRPTPSGGHLVARRREAISNAR